MKILIALACLFFVQLPAEAQTGNTMNLFKSLSVLSPEMSIPGKIPAVHMTSYPVFSNPANGIFNLLMEGDYGQVSRIELYNMFGKCLFNSQVHTFRSKLTGIMNGVYFIRFISEDKMVTRKIAIGVVNAEQNRFAVVDLN